MNVGGIIESVFSIAVGKSLVDVASPPRGRPGARFTPDPAGQQ
jgi:hypothetical protein